MAVIGSESLHESEHGLRRVPMSWEDYLALPEEVFAEWVDGVAVVSPRPSRVHGATVARLGALLLGALSGLDVVVESGLVLHLDGEHAAGEVTVGEHGVVGVDLDVLMPW